MSDISKKLKLHRGSDLWRIMSDIIGKKSEAQKDLDIIQSALKLQDLVNAEMLKPHLVNTADVLRHLVEESEK